jgi:hypothetical protein
MTEMSPAEEIFFNALNIQSPTERAAYLEQACANQPELLARVQKLLAAQPKVGQFLEAKIDDQATRDFQYHSDKSTVAHVPAPDR